MNQESPSYIWNICIHIYRSSVRSNVGYHLAPNPIFCIKPNIIRNWVTEAVAHIRKHTLTIPHCRLSLLLFRNDEFLNLFHGGHIDEGLEVHRFGCRCQGCCLSKIQARCNQADISKKLLLVTDVGRYPNRCWIRTVFTLQKTIKTCHSDLECFSILNFVFQQVCHIIPYGS